jgi:hypothetical protein
MQIFFQEKVLEVVLKNEEVDEGLKLWRNL